MGGEQEDDGLVDLCEVCDDGPEVVETTVEPGFEGTRVVVCVLCRSVYDAATGELIQEGHA